MGNQGKPKGTTDIFHPGKAERGIEAEERQEGIPLSRAVYGKIRDSGENLGMKSDFARSNPVRLIVV